jgi:hypothetical protein
MAILLKFRNICLFKDQPYGINKLNFEIERGRKYLLQTRNEEQLHSLAGLIEGRFKKQSGLIEHADKLFIQSDRLLMGDKVYSQTVNQWLLLKNDSFLFGKRRRSKFGMIQTIKAKHLVDYPIYKLREADKIKFTLLALAFQEKGMILISRLLTLHLEESLLKFLQRIIDETHTTCCLLACPTESSLIHQLDIPEVIKLDLNEHYNSGHMR